MRGQKDSEADSIPVGRLDRINVEALTGPPAPDRPDDDAVIPSIGGRTVEQWARRFDCSPQTVRRWLDANGTKRKRYGDQFVIAEADLWDATPYAASRRAAR